MAHSPDQPTPVTALAAAVLGACALMGDAAEIDARTPTDSIVQGRVLELDWKELLPATERARFSPAAPAPVHDARGEAGPPAIQSLDFKANKALDGVTVRLPGFIVPLEPPGRAGLGDFLLVPYFGSCIHVPPPPPNQLVYVRPAHRTAIESIYDAYWITGKLRLQTRTTRLGASAYELTAERIEPYRYP